MDIKALKAQANKYDDENCPFSSAMIWEKVVALIIL
jgi:hypothetical protein